DEFGNVGWNYSPCAVDSELNQKCAGGQHCGRRREHPQWNNENRNAETHGNRSPSANSIRHHCNKDPSDKDAQVRNHCHYSGGLRSKTALRFEKCWIHVLRAVSAKTHEGQKQYEIKKQLQVRANCTREVAPFFAVCPFPNFGFLDPRPDE